MDEYKIGDVATALGTTVRAIRFYEEEGLLEPRRTEGGTRLYTQRHVDRLKAILHLVENGFSIEAIRLIASIRAKCKSGDESSRKVTAQLDEEIAEIATRIEALERLRAELGQAKAAVGHCKGCKNTPTSKGCPNCPVQGRLHRVEVLNLIWDQGD